MMKMTRRLEFDAGHRLVGHESKCANLHGHRYVVDVDVELTGALDSVGRIVDFGDVKAKFGAWLDDTLDHAFIVNAADPLVDAIKSSGRHVVVPFEPTAEHLATWLLDVAAGMLDVPGQRRVCRVVVHETPNCMAEVSR